MRTFHQCMPVVPLLRTLLPNVNKIITIGWRATEQHFLTMLKKPLSGLQGDVDLMVVSGSDTGASETVNNLAIRQSGQRKREYGEFGFSGLIRQIEHSNPSCGDPILLKPVVR